MNMILEQKETNISGSEIISGTECAAKLNIDPLRPEQLPFIPIDCTAGSENELQVAVCGSSYDVDLPRYIRESNYFRNVMRRIQSGDTSRGVASRLERYLDDNPDSIWENSWVTFPADRLCPHTRRILASDMKSERGDNSSRLRSDHNRFHYQSLGTEWLRLPLSYVIKLALADVLHSRSGIPFQVMRKGEQMLDHFLNDNTSPETHSFHVCSSGAEKTCGQELAKETSIRFLMTHLLVCYANMKFGIKENGQEALLFFSPHPPVRQKFLNESISDSFYRELYMSPCLSGWQRGEEKHRYMGLCHRVLSRSHLNAIAKLKEADIIVNNLVMLPSNSNISLANNGTHISIGSRLLTNSVRDGSSFTPYHEKHMGDLSIKITEHFIPLFIGLCSASPYRLDFTDFCPEKILGFLPHELDFSHLRMIWRRWQKKARNKVLGNSLCPLGPDPVDGVLRQIFDLRGDMVPDFRLLDYPVALMSTETSSPLDGTLGNWDTFLRDLEDLGVFDHRMSVYLPIKNREYSRTGFTGLEARYFSLFENMNQDMALATDMQILITALAYRLILTGGIDHRHIPHTPYCDSERRQAMFCAAIGIPTFYIRENSPNVFLLSIARQTEGVRKSNRYQGYLRIPLKEYRTALLRYILREGADLAEMMGLKEAIREMMARVEDPSLGVAQRLTRSILTRSGSNDPFRMSGWEFNMTAEKFYREDLLKKHLSEGINFLAEETAMHEKNIASAWNNSGDEFTAHIESLLAKAADSVSDKGRSIDDITDLLLLIISNETGYDR